MKLTITDVKKNYEEKEVLKGVNYTFESGKIYGLLGRNGAGKTTFFNIVNKDIPADDGVITLDDQPLGVDDIGYVVSTPVVPSFLTAREFLKFFIDINKDKMKEVQRPDYYFDMVGIGYDDRDKLLKDYSHGMKTKMQVIINVISNCKVLLLDEPLTALDVVAADEMKKILKRQKQDKIMIFSTHIMELALTLCDEIVLLRNGTVERLNIYDENGVKLDDETLRDTIISALKEGA
ncbi:MAG: ABC transporter ATP-binding protein [Saccharofermentans sp.]|nr:ABC transporter ATP-binding protein [Saccharofermentans sp.]